MLLIALPTGLFQSAVAAYVLFLIYLGALSYKRLKNGRARDVLPLIGLGLAPLVLFALAISIG